MKFNNYKFKEFLIFKSILIYLSTFILFLSISIYFFTPSNNIIFWDFDSRTNIDEILQILSPSGVYDFIFDAAYGNYVPYGRIYFSITALLTFLLDIFLNFSIPVLIYLSHLILIFTSNLIIVESIFKNNSLKFILLPNLLLFCYTSKVLIKTTSVELFIISIIIFLLFKSNLNKKEIFIYVFFGILSGIKFIHIVYPIVYFLVNKKNIKSFFQNIFLGIAGLLIAQPYILVPKGFKHYFKFVFETLNYTENYTVTYKDWIITIFNEFNFLIILIPLIFLFFNINRVTLDSNVKFLILSPLLQILTFFFSDNLIRAHYLNLPMTLIVVFLFNELTLKKSLKISFLSFYLLFNIIYFVQSSLEIPNLAKASDYQGYMNLHYDSESYKAMSEVNNFVLNEVRKNSDKLIWWEASNQIRPYSTFHWGSTELPESATYYYKDIWSDIVKFSKDRCSDFGGIIVTSISENNVKEVKDNLLIKNFQFIKKFEFKNINRTYYVFYNSKFSHPVGC